MQLKLTDEQKRIMGKELLNNWFLTRMTDNKAMLESGLALGDIAGALGGERFVDDTVFLQLKAYLTDTLALQQTNKKNH